MTIFLPVGLDKRGVRSGIFRGLYRFMDAPVATVLWYFPIRSTIFLSVGLDERGVGSGSLSNFRGFRSFDRSIDVVVVLLVRLNAQAGPSNCTKKAGTSGCRIRLLLHVFFRFIKEIH